MDDEKAAIETCVKATAVFLIEEKKEKGPARWEYPRYAAFSLLSHGQDPLAAPAQQLRASR